MPKNDKKFTNNGTLNTTTITNNYEFINNANSAIFANTINNTDNAAISNYGGIQTNILTNTSSILGTGNLTIIEQANNTGTIEQNNIIIANTASFDNTGSIKATLLSLSESCL